MLQVMQTLKAVGRHIRTTLIAGVVIIIPVAVTFLILKFVFDFFDPLLQPFFERTTGRYYEGMGIISLVIIIYLAGLVTTQVLGRRIIEFGHSMVDRIPVVSGLYRAVRQATDVFSNVGSNGKFGSVVLVDFPGHGLKSIGLVTGKLKDQDGNTLLAVYMPTSPVPTSGFLVILPEDRVTPTDLPVDDAVKLIVSAGVIVPGEINSYPNPSASAPSAGSEQTHTPDNRASNQ